MNRSSESGFTMIEMLMALAVFALISSLTYGVVGTAGDGFQMLDDSRQASEKATWIGKQLRSDLRYLSNIPLAKQSSQGAAGNFGPLRISNDNRGDIELDELWLLVREPAMPGISVVRYYIDEETGHLKRESRLMQARDLVESMVWDLGEVSSWAVEVLDESGNWRQDWKFENRPFEWPRAVRVKMKFAEDRPVMLKQREWLYPLLLGQKL